MGLLPNDKIDYNTSVILDFATKVKYLDEYGNDYYDFDGEIEYIYNNKRINEIGKFVVRNIEGYSSPGILILSESLEINKDKVHIEFNTAFQNFELQIG